MARAKKTDPWAWLGEDNDQGNATVKGPAVKKPVKPVVPPKKK